MTGGDKVRALDWELIAEAALMVWAGADREEVEDWWAGLSSGYGIMAEDDWARVQFLADNMVRAVVEGHKAIVEADAQEAVRKVREAGGWLRGESLGG